MPLTLLHECITDTQRILHTTCFNEVKNTLITSNALSIVDIILNFVHSIETSISIGYYCTLCIIRYDTIGSVCRKTNIIHLTIQISQLIAEFLFFFYICISGIEKQKVISNDPQNTFASHNLLNEKWVNLCRMRKDKFQSFLVEWQTVGDILWLIFSIWFQMYGW